MSEETIVETPAEIQPTITVTPDGPTELPPDPGLADPNLNPPLTNKAKPAEGKEKAKPEPAYKYDARNAIYARRSAKMAEDQAASDEMFDEGRQTSGLPREEPAQPATPVALSDEFVTIKVYGEERQAPKADVEKAGGVAAYQKAVAADVKLQQAAQREAELSAKEARLLQIAQNLRNGLDENGQPLAPKPPVTGVPASAISKDALEATVKGLYSGDAEEATAALGTLIEQIAARQGTSNQVSPEIVRAVTAQVEERIQAREATSMEARDVAEANRIFREDFKDIANDPDMMVWAKGMANTLANAPENQGKSRSEIAREVGNRIREKLGRPKSEIESRRKLKESLPQSPSGSGRVPSTEAPRFPTNADYIQQLRRNSGSNSAPR